MVKENGEGNDPPEISEEKMLALTKKSKGRGQAPRFQYRTAITRHNTQDYAVDPWISFFTILS